MDDVKFFGDYRPIYPGRYDNINKGVKDKLIELIDAIDEHKDIDWDSMRIIVKGVNIDYPTDPMTVAIKYKASARPSVDVELGYLRTAEYTVEVDKRCDRSATTLPVPAVETLIRLAKKGIRGNG